MADVGVHEDAVAAAAVEAARVEATPEQAPNDDDDDDEDDDDLFGNNEEDEPVPPPVLSTIHTSSSTATNTAIAFAIATSSRETIADAELLKSEPAVFPNASSPTRSVPDTATSSSSSIPRKPSIATSLTNAASPSATSTLPALSHPVQTPPKATTTTSIATTTTTTTTTTKNNPSLYGLAAGTKIPDTITAALLQDRLLDALKTLPVHLINDALQEYDDAVRNKGESIRNRGGYLYGVIKRYVSVHERATVTGTNRLLPMGQALTPAILQRLETLVQSGYCTSRAEMREQVQDKIRMLAEPDAFLALEELVATDRAHVRHLGSFFMGILNRYMRGDDSSYAKQQKQQQHQQQHQSKPRGGPDAFLSSRATGDRGRDRFRERRDNNNNNNSFRQQPPDSSSSSSSLYASNQRDRSRDRFDMDRPQQQQQQRDRQDRRPVYDSRQQQQHSWQQQQQPPHHHQQQQQISPPPMGGYNNGMGDPNRPMQNIPMQPPGMPNYAPQQQQHTFMQQPMYRQQQQQQPISSNPQQQQYMGAPPPGNIPPPNMGGMPPHGMGNMPPSMNNGPNMYQQQQPMGNPQYMGNQQQQQHQPNQFVQSPNMGNQLGMGGPPTQMQPNQYQPQGTIPGSYPPPAPGGWQQPQQLQLPPPPQGQVPIDIMGLADKAASAVQALTNQNKMQNSSASRMYSSGPPTPYSNYGGAPPMGGPPPQQQPGYMNMPYPGAQQQPPPNPNSNQDQQHPLRRSGGGARRTEVNASQLPFSVQVAVTVSVNDLIRSIWLRA